MQHSMRSILYSLWINQVALASSASDALQKVKWQVFDAILCDYNLGSDKKDGQQTLEEMRSYNHIPLETVFIMVTAEANYEKVVSAAEYAPDEYVVKPFSINVLKNRLSTGFLKKAIFLWIYEQTSKGNLASAAAECDEIWKKYPKYETEALRLKGKLLLAMNMPKEAEKLYYSIVKKHAIPWARLGLAHSFHRQKKYAEAEVLLWEIIAKNPAIVESYDLLAAIQGEQGRVIDMQRTLESAVKVSPKSLTRQRNLGDAAFKNNDIATAERAYEKIVEEKHASTFRSIDMATLARSYLQRSDVRSAKHLMDNQRTFLSKTNEGKMIVSVTMADISYKSGDETSSKRHIADAMRVKRKSVQIDPAILIDLVGVCLNNSMDEVATSIGSELWQTTTLKKEELERLQDSFLKAGIESPIPNETTRTPLDISKEAHKKMVTRLSREGVKIFNTGNFRWAYEKLKEARQQNPTGQQEALNLTIVIAHILNREGLDMLLIREGRASLAFLGSVNSQDSRYHKMLIEWEKLETRFETIKMPNV